MERRVFITNLEQQDIYNDHTTRQCHFPDLMSGGGFVIFTRRWFGWNPCMVSRVFVGWDAPFLDRAVDWWLERKDELTGVLVIVPTSQSGRRFRDKLTQKAGALLSPRVITPAWFLRTPDPDIAPDWLEHLLWHETLGTVGDWGAFPNLFPDPPDTSGDWARGLAGEFTRLRRRLQENGHTLASAARVLGQSADGNRWSDLAKLEVGFEKRLAAMKLRSRSRVLAGGVAIPEGLTGIVVAGVTEMPGLLERALESWNGTVTVLIGAPAEEAEHFSPLGLPLESWAERHQPWPDAPLGSVRLAADAGQQAAEAFQAVCEHGLPSDQVALGCADPEVSGAVARVFSSGGWPAFDPSSQPALEGLPRFLRTWSQWLESGRLTHARDLFALPECARLIGGKRASKTETLCRLMDQSMASSTADIQRILAGDAFRSEDHRAAAQDLLRALTALERHRSAFLNGAFPDALASLLESLGDPVRDTPEAEAIMAWLDQAAPLMERFSRGASFWLDLMLAEIPRPAPVPPEGRVIDVQGWLELFFEPGRHLVICGMNEGRVPATTAGDPWLGEGASKLLGLVHNSRRAARDAFLHFAMIEARRSGGRVDLICAKSGAGGDSLLPSRLLLTTHRDELPDRVSFLFREVQPPEAGLRWQADWKWQPGFRETKPRLSATSLRDWLACPFRFYLKHTAAMAKPEPERVEWNQRDFGNVAHAVLETWGRDPEARDFSKSEALEAWFSRELDSVVASWFGANPPLAVRIQTESLRQRLAWLARVQAHHRASGWQVIEVEHKFELAFGNHTVVAKIDRIDRNRHDGTLRVIDYKTGKVENVLRSHLRKITANSHRPAHLPEKTAAWFHTTEGSKPADYLWHNLQLPLYACAILDRDGLLPEPCYFTIGSTETEVAIDPWEDFGHEMLQAARDCAGWVVQQIAEGVFWPPAERVTYDDLAPLSGGRPIEECFEPPPHGPLPPNPAVASPETPG